MQHGTVIRNTGVVAIKRLPPLNSLRSFEAAARQGSFQAAARELFVTPSAVSHQIKALEEFLGLPLFVRQTRRVQLTSAGKEYVKSVQKALREVERATQNLVSTHGSGELKLAVAPAFLTRWLLPRMALFSEQYPDIELQISASTGLLDFGRDDVDMAVYYGDGQWEDLECLFMRQSVLIPVCAPSLLARKPIKEPADVFQHRLIHVSKRIDEWRTWSEAAEIEYQESRKGLVLSSGSLAAGAAVRGLGIALTDVSLIREEIQSGELVIPLDIPLPKNKSFYLVYAKHRPAGYAMRMFRDWIMEQMSEDVAQTSQKAKTA